MNIDYKYTVTKVRDLQPSDIIVRGSELFPNRLKRCAMVISCTPCDSVFAYGLCRGMAIKVINVCGDVQTTYWFDDHLHHEFEIDIEVMRNG